MAKGFNFALHCLQVCHCNLCCIKKNMFQSKKCQNILLHFKLKAMNDEIDVWWNSQHCLFFINTLGFLFRWPWKSRMLMLMLLQLKSRSSCCLFRVAVVQGLVLWLEIWGRIRQISIQNCSYDDWTVLGDKRWFFAWLGSCRLQLLLPGSLSSRRPGSTVPLLTSLVVTNKWSGRQQVCLKSRCVGVFSCVGALIDHRKKKVNPITITNSNHANSHFSWICMAVGTQAVIRASQHWEYGLRKNV